MGPQEEHSRAGAACGLDESSYVLSPMRPSLGHPPSSRPVSTDRHAKPRRPRYHPEGAPVGRTDAEAWDAGGDRVPEDLAGRGLMLPENGVAGWGGARAFKGLDAEVVAPGMSSGASPSPGQQAVEVPLGARPWRCTSRDTLAATHLLGDAGLLPADAPTSLDCEGRAGAPADWVLHSGWRDTLTRAGTWS